MTYIIKSARFANAEHTAVVADTVEVAHVVLSAADTPREWARIMRAAATGDLAIANYVRPPSPSDRSSAEKLDTLLASAGLTLEELKALLA